MNQQTKPILGRRKLRDLSVSSIGYGCMGLSHGYGPCPPKEQCIKLLQQAYELGYTFFDTAEVYGEGENERLLGEAFKSIRTKIEIATKLFIVPSPNQSLEDHIRLKLTDSLQRLQTDYIDLYYLHRCNPSYNIEEIALIMGKLIKEQKIKGWGLSQADAETIRRAHAVTPLTAIQSEYSLMERMFETDVIPTCAELNIGFVPFSPLASGFLCGNAKRNEDYIGDDVRRVITRFHENNVKANQPLMDVISKFAEKKGISTTKVALSWILNKYPSFVVPIPGGRTYERMKENAESDLVKISQSEMEEFEKDLSKVKIYGNRTDKDIIEGLQTIKMKEKYN